ncbi:MAG: FeoB-associated Cys-rich membrane protein [Oscillospiraceae bacterium]|nr:FeoB-associated Cys-rich membrane protein [Oscillospiraceae bacterium]
MKPIDYIIIGVVAVVIGLVLFYIHKAKKKGVKCIGCPDGGNCSGNCSGCSGNCSCKH